jgi:hypothetical protein
VPSNRRDEVSKTKVGKIGEVWGKVNMYEAGGKRLSVKEISGEDFTLLITETPKQRAVLYTSLHKQST